MKPLRELILELLEDEGPTYPYAIYRKIRERGHKARYGTIRWQVLFLAREDRIRSIPPGEARNLGLQVTPDRSGKSGTRPPMDRRYYEITSLR